LLLISELKNNNSFLRFSTNANEQQEYSNIIKRKLMMMIIINNNDVMSK